MLTVDSLGRAQIVNTQSARRLAPFVADDAATEPHSPSGRAALTSGAVAMLAQFGTSGGRLVRRSVATRGPSPAWPCHGWPLGIYLVSRLNGTQNAD
jgi:hypothetical protein